ncbi:hypothetical protein LEP1GSC060_2620 [Leptospira weilii serovar Ranarum str. ICFT]|uniref:Uncharacterized protein n=1 Tax=Leptospira weilii serovar Ranarum str. ICFT TaxID=1218598 RepID=N1WGU3_9LEPT|nr:hypothetical protein LEP1GSC060_2620 [Leptospira weilii serovar Ranarum str. ICFT]
MPEPKISDQVVRTVPKFPDLFNDCCIRVVEKLILHLFLLYWFKESSILIFFWDKLKMKTHSGSFIYE